MPFYRPSTGGGKSGPGISNDGYEGANTLFEQAKGVLGDMGCPFIPSNAQEAASAKAAADAYMACRNGTVPSEQAFLHESQCPKDFPDVALDGTGTAGPTDIGKALGDMMHNMGDMLNQVMTAGPGGILSQLMTFLFKVFTEMASGISQAIMESANAAAAAIEEALKKQLEMASSAAQGLQPLELYTQQATTQTLSHAMKTASGT